MKIIIVQGMTCVGKSTLCKQLVKKLNRSKYFSLDEYKEYIWDKFGFDSIKQREQQSNFSKKIFYNDINDAIKNYSYDYILIEHAFIDKNFDELINNIEKWNVPVKTIYLKPLNLQEHKKAWESRSRNFSVRHAGHGATHYHNGIGSDYTNTYENQVYKKMPTIGNVLEVQVSFTPYSQNKTYDNIVNFIKNK